MFEPDSLLEMAYEERVAPTQLDDEVIDYDEDLTYGPPSYCFVCGDHVDYCQGHGESGDPAGASIVHQHDMGDHSHCHPNGCDEVNEAMQ